MGFFVQVLPNLPELGNRRRWVLTHVVDCKEITKLKPVKEKGGITIKFTVL